MTEIIEPECSQDELVSNDNFLLYESPKKKLNATLESIGVSLGNIHAVAQHSRASNAKSKLEKVLNVYIYNVSDVETEEQSPIYDRALMRKLTDV